MNYKDAKVTAILESVGLGDRSEYYPENLSRGQKQRVATARANSLWPMNSRPLWIKSQVGTL